MFTYAEENEIKENESMIHVRRRNKVNRGSVFRQVDGGGNRRCPKPIDIQDIPSDFNWDQFIGTTPYYELAVHDITQPNRAGCIRSYKHFTTNYSISNNTNDEIVNPSYIIDNFTMSVPYCPTIPFVGPISISYLQHKTTNQMGVLEGSWSIVPNIIFPNTVVAVGVPDTNNDTTTTNSNEYRWVIEFQCLEVLNRIAFVGINFYSRANIGLEADRNYQEMYDSAIRLGLDQYWNNTLGLRRVNHTNCDYENQKPSAQWTNVITSLSRNCPVNKVE